MPLDEPTSRAKPRSTTTQPRTQRQTPHPQPKRGDGDENPLENHTARIDHIDRPGRRCHATAYGRCACPATPTRGNARSTSRGLCLCFSMGSPSSLQSVIRVHLVCFQSAFRAWNRSCRVQRAPVPLADRFHVRRRLIVIQVQHGQNSGSLPPLAHGSEAGGCDCWYPPCVCCV